MAADFDFFSSGRVFSRNEIYFFTSSKNITASNFSEKSRFSGPGLGKIMDFSKIFGSGRGFEPWLGQIFSKKFFSPKIFFFAQTTPKILFFAQRAKTPLSAKKNFFFHTGSPTPLDSAKIPEFGKKNFFRPNDPKSAQMTQKGPKTTSAEKKLIFCTHRDTHTGLCQNVGNWLKTKEKNTTGKYSHSLAKMLRSPGDPYPEKIQPQRSAEPVWGHRAEQGLLTPPKMTKRR